MNNEITLDKFTCKTKDFNIRARLVKLQDYFKVRILHIDKNKVEELLIKPDIAQNVFNEYKRTMLKLYPQE